MAAYGPWDVDTQNPVSDDPLNRGLVSWWLGLPGQTGGGRLSDLMGRNHGTLQAGGARPAWVTGPNGFGALDGDGSDYVSLGSAASSLSITGAISVFALVRKEGITFDDHLIGSYNTGAPFNGWALSYIASSNRPTFWSNNIGSWRIANTVTPLNEWSFLGVTGGGSAGAFYLNGDADGTFVYSAPSAYTGNRSLMARADGVGPFPGKLAALAVYDRALSAAEVRALYADWLAGYPRTLRRWRRRGLLVSLPTGGVTYTASAALAAGGASLSASATHTPPTFTGAATLTAAGAELSASATHATPASTASAAVTAAGAELSASGTHAPPSFTASAALAAGGAELSASATHTPPTYAAAATLTSGGAEASAAATFTPPAYAASAALTSGGAEASAAAASTPPSFTAAAALTAAGAEASASATFTAPVFDASAALAAGGAGFAASASHAAAIYQASAALTVGGAEASASASFDAGTFTAAAPLAAAAAELTASATFTAPAYAASATLAAAGAELAASASFAAAARQAAATLVAAGAELSASAAFTPPAYTAAAALTAGGVEFAAEATAFVAGDAALLQHLNANTLFIGSGGSL